MENKKNLSLDLLRIIAIFLVIVIHFSNYYCRLFGDVTISNFAYASLFNGISRICVPIFFMISGALLIGRQEKLIKHKKRVLKFLKILVVWTIIYMVWKLFYLDQPFGLTTIYLTFFEPISNHLWFMYVIIGFYLILPFIQKMFLNLDEKMENYFIILWAFFSGVVYLIRIFAIDNWLFPTKIDYSVPLVQGTYYLGYFIIGYIIYKRIKTIKNTKRVRTLLLSVFLVCSFLTIICTLWYSIKTNSYYSYFFGYRSILTIMASISIYLLVLLQQEKIEKSEKLKKYINLIAPTTFGIYLIHVIFLQLVFYQFNIVQLTTLIFIPIFSIIVFIVSFSIVYLLKKIPIIKDYI